MVSIIYALGWYPLIMHYMVSINYALYGIHYLCIIWYPLFMHWDGILCIIWYPLFMHYMVSINLEVCVINHGILRYIRAGENNRKFMECR